MTITIDVERLRRDLTDEYGTAMFNGFPAAMLDLGRIEAMSDLELCEFAQREGIDLTKYQV